MTAYAPSKTLSGALDDEWEPFAATIETGLDGSHDRLIWLRKKLNVRKKKRL